MSAVTFDVWHTLLYLTPDDEERYYQAQLALASQTLREARRRADAPEGAEADLTPAFERILLDAVVEAEQGRSVTPGQQILRAGDEVGREVRPAPYLAQLEALVVRQPFRPAPHAIDLLGSLHEEGYRIGLLGNTVGETGASIRRVLTRMGFAPYVDTFVFSDEHPWAKPAPEIFWEALHRLGETPERAAHVGDAWFDIEGARRARFRAAVLFTGLQNYGPHYRALHVRARGTSPEPDRTVEDLGEVSEFLHQVLPRPGKRG